MRNKIVLYALFVFIAVLGNAKINQKHRTKINNTLNINIEEYGRDAYYAWQEEDYTKALELSLKYWEANRDNLNGIFSVASCYAQLNEPELCGKFLLEATKFGLTNLDQRLDGPQYEEIKRNPVFQDYLSQVEDILYQKNKEKGEIAYIEVPTKLRYRTVLPDNFDPEKSYPVLIFLHGFGGNHLNFSRYSSLVAEKQIIFIMPQAPYPFETFVTREPSFSWTIFDVEEEDNGLDPSELTSRVSWSMSDEYIVQLSRFIRTQYHVQSIFLAGFSQGGFRTLAGGLTFPNDYDGLICFGGGLFFTEEETIPIEKELPILIVHGDSDLVVSFESGLQAYNMLTKAGYHVQMQTFAGAHTVPKEEFIKALEWMVSQQE